MTELSEIFKKIRDIGIMPVIKLDKAEDAVPLAKEGKLAEALEKIFANKLHPDDME